MKSLKTTEFFLLNDFPHRALFTAYQYPWEVLSVIEEYLNSQPLGKIEVDIPEGVILENPHLISIGEGTIVERGAYIRGPVLIGKKCTIRHGAYIRGQLLTGDECVIGHATEVKNSIFFDGAQAAHFAYVGDSILGRSVNLGAGTKLANLKMDHQEIVIDWDYGQVSTGLRKLGAIIGDRSQIGCNAVTNPGTLIGPEVFWYPCVNFGGVVSTRSIVKPAIKSQVVDYKNVTH